ncbi:long-chain acyl-CoA synthetase [Pseudomonas sp. NFACC23-1]|uniref:class I adenylate-forming enzyme family protein n=1 Tax=unclassified Pseudomonas TaxID=196821 RepID=UPI000883AEF5|nr:MULTISPECIES: AMP-binding protein [unclassified Pseudomonas]SDB10776.1 long-chain acyl-CoA synthetase [Pseudomonas sp. NFACC17-2]SEI90993.1 long-chain acyl-CoA synthetase [Pseudomonas sp. NFACC23-1]SFW17989.1 long-chain acyl-CoA synthetase [Pseudomonas sp. NFACC16-2]
MEHSIGNWVGQSAARFGNKPAIIFEGKCWSFLDIDVQSSRLAASLESMGVKREEVVSIYSSNSPEWVITYYAILKIGAIVNPLNMMLTACEAAFAIKNCGAVAVFSTSDKLLALQEHIGPTEVTALISFDGVTVAGMQQFNLLVDANIAVPEYPVTGIQKDDISTIGYTSGTTGQPKGAVLSHRCILTNVSMTATMHLRTASDTAVSALPLSHVYGNVVMNSAIAYGMTLVLHKTFDAEAVLSSIQTYGATLLEGVPTMYIYLLNYPNLGAYDVSSLTRCTVGGQTMPYTAMEEVERALGCRLLELWGMTELGGLGTTHSFYGERRLGSIGVALPHLEARISQLELDGDTLPLGEIGELQIRGPVVMKHYLGRPDATAETKTDEGWLRTGDLARMDSEGFIYIVDRLKDMFITAGFNIYPAELERVIAEHPSVAMVAVGSVLDEVKGELAKAYIVPKIGYEIDTQQIERHCRDRLAAYKVPRLFQIVEDLPKTSSGKVMRRMLRQVFESKL